MLAWINAQYLRWLVGWFRGSLLGVARFCDFVEGRFFCTIWGGWYLPVIWGQSLWWWLWFFFVVISNMVKNAACPSVALFVSRMPSLRRAEVMLSECRGCVGICICCGRGICESALLRGFCWDYGWPIYSLFGVWLFHHLLLNPWCLSGCVQDPVLLSWGDLVLSVAVGSVWSLEFLA